MTWHEEGLGTKRSSPDDVLTRPLPEDTIYFVGLVFPAFTYLD